MGIIAFSIGDFHLYWYGVLVSFAVILGLLITKLNLYFRHENIGYLAELFICSIVGGIIGARLGYVILNFSLYQKELSEIFAIHHGGVSVYGAVIGAVLAIFICACVQRLRFWYCLDILTPAFIMGLAIMQLGNFALQATVGLPVTGNEVNDSKFIEYVEYSFRPAGFAGYEYFQPVALYQAIWLLMIFAFVIRMSIKMLHRYLMYGNIFLKSVIFVCLGRIGLGFLYLGAGNGVSLGQIICVATVIGCILTMKNNRRIAKKTAKNIIFMDS